MVKLLETARQLRMFWVWAVTNESGRGQPHCKTLRRHEELGLRDGVLECGCPLPLFFI